ncbi:MAG: cytochrome P460 family protein [Thermodesulfovibrionales bacterium]|nr:cytochrome P460 family protein [Thermodesulfovibrionales bacterium]
MSLKTLIIILSFFITMSIVFSAQAIHKIIPSESTITEPGADPEKLLEYITTYYPYRLWSLWPNKGKLYKGTEPHGALLTTFVNDTALDSIKKKKGMQDGSIIVKENYTADKKFISLSIMYKIKGYNPEGGDWFWAKYSPDGKTEAYGKVKGCIACHSQKKDNDFIFISPVK